MNTKYEDIKNLYFSNKALNGERCRESLKIIMDEKNNESARAAYLLGIICLRNAIEFDKPLDRRDYYDNWVIEKQAQFFQEGLTCLEKAIDSGSEDAGHLLGQIYARPRRQRDVDVILDGKIIITYTGEGCDFPCPDSVQRCYGNFLLQSGYSGSMACTQLLCDLASDYFEALNDLSSEELPINIFNIFSSKADLECERYCKSIQPENDSDPEITEEVQDKLRVFAHQGSYRAIMLCKQLNIELKSPHEELLWKARYEAYTSALEWINHGTKLGCDINLATTNACQPLLKLFQSKGCSSQESSPVLQRYIFWKADQSDIKILGSTNEIDSGPGF